MPLPNQLRHGRLSADYREDYPGMASPLWKKTLAFLAMALGLAVTGGLLGLLGAFASGVALRRSAFGLAGLGVVILVMLAGYLAGVIVGVIVTDKVVHYRGSVWLGILGSIAGMGVSAGIAGLLSLNSGPELLFGSIFAAIPMLGTAGFHLRRKARGGRDEPAGGGAELGTGGDGRI